MPVELERVRRLIERGLERYGRGQLAEAIAEWEHALLLDERNAEARGLIAFVRDKLMAGGTDPARWQNEFAVVPETEGQGLTGWTLADEPPPRPSPETDTPPPEVDHPMPIVGGRESEKRSPTWGGHGRAEPVGIPGEGDPLQQGYPPPTESTTDPGPQVMAKALDDLDWSGVNPGTRLDGAWNEKPTVAAQEGQYPPPALAADGPAEGDGGGLFDEYEAPGPGKREPHITLESPIPGLLAATMPTLPGEAPKQAPQGAPATPVADHAETTRPVGGSRPTLTFGAPGAAPTPPLPAAPPHAMPALDVTGDPSRASRKRASDLVDRAREDFDGGSIEGAAEAAEFALTEGERAPPPGIAEVIEPARPLFERIFEAHVGPIQGVPVVTLTAHEIAAMTFDHRTGFLLSRIDGSMTVEEILDISGMGTFESFRILSSLLRSGIVAVK